jgi:hypothetical protein
MLPGLNERIDDLLGNIYFNASFVSSQVDRDSNHPCHHNPRKQPTPRTTGDCNLDHFLS